MRAVSAKALSALLLSTLLRFTFPLPFLCLSFAFPLPFLSAADLWFSATITDMNIRIKVTILLNIKVDTL